ncbi:SpoIIE family protein phosphatase [Cellulomonas marina]|uniref:PAS domain S-box-containing protein n=1 Tax=Cellulomonas marina TaxID=988821 RepID=A0A1I1AUD9_9CELL|nr:SpoIIE family protein phosphatase [Cellulomonas marina]GIG30728.1 hypothetical protein Cma02nite_33280 [Cellulomonas marina]SFB41699.1 PAS domain S-box-containing protein [Cellulomonas marina]
MDAAARGTGDVDQDAQAARTAVADARRTESARRLLAAATSRGDAALQVVAALAARLLRAPSAEVCLLTDERVVVGAVGPGPGPAGTRTSLEAALCTRVVARGEELVVTDAVHDPRTADAEAVRAGGLVAYVAVPLVGDAGHAVGAVCVHGPEPRVWTGAEVEALRELAAAAAGQCEVARLDHQYADAERSDLLATAAEAAGLGTFRWDLRDGSLHWDAALLEAFGYDEQSFGGTIDAFDARLHPADLPPVRVALSEAIAACGVYEAEFRVVRPDGTTRWISARGRALPGPGGEAEQVVGVTTDTTALRVGEERVREILEGMSVGYFRLDADWRFSYVNTAAERILGAPRDRLLGEVVWEAFPAAVGSTFESSYRGVAATGEPAVFDAYYPAPLDAWFEVRAVPEDGGVAAYFTDVTARRRALEATERAQRRSALLAGVAGVLAETLDPVAALEAVVGVLVPELADLAVASLLDDGHGPWEHRLRDVAGRDADPARSDDLEQYLRLRVPALTRTSPVARALSTGRPVTVVQAGEQAAGDLLDAGPAHELLQRLAPHATVVLPVRGRGHTRGLLTLVNRAERGTFSPDDLGTLADVVSQVGLALDNAHLNATRRTLVEELQRSLLTALPEPDHLHLVARYVPATRGAQIGGDWYDAFLVRDGSTCLVIGDVAGHDLRAAVAMAQVRNVLRGGAHAVVEPPAIILGSLDLAMHDLAIGSLTTAVLAKVEQTPELAAAGRRRLRWSNAGHLPPLLVHPDGRAELLARPSDILLGLVTGADRHDHVAELDPGSLLLLYTDGLVERRGEGLTQGLERLRTTAEGLAGLPTGEFCDRLIAALAPDAQDDVALLAVRLHPEDQERPAEAGPRVLPADLRAEG